MTREWRWNPWLMVLLLTSAMAMAMSFGRLHEFHSADSILPVLVSLQRWTPFFWQQDRFGMLVPLLAIPVADPLMNLVLQGWIMATAALAAPFIVARLLVDERQHWIVAGAVANILLLVLPRLDVQFDWLVVQPYAASIAMAGAGQLAVARNGRPGWVAAAVLMILAHWVNVGVIVVAMPLAVLRRHHVLRTLAVTTCGFATGVAFSRLSSYRTPDDVLSPAEWPRAWAQLATNGMTIFAHPAAPAAIAAAAAMAAAVIWRRARVSVRERRHLTAAAIALLVAVIYWLAAGASRWVQVNLYFPRYIYPSLLMCGVAAGLVAAVLPRDLMRRSTLAAALALSVLTVFRYGVPSPARLRATIDHRYGRLTADAIGSGVTVIGGSYWVVWPSVFHANLDSYRLGGRPVYGLTYRSLATDGLWKNNSSEIVLAAVAGDRTIAGWASRIGLTITWLERRGAIDIYVARKPAAY